MADERTENPGKPRDPTRAPGPGGAPGRDGHASCLKAAVVLAGSTRASALCRVAGRAVVDLPLTPDETLLDYWQHELVDLALALGLEGLTVRVMVDRGGVKPTLRGSEPPLTVRLEEDPYDYRGTGGLLSDLAREYDDDDELLVISGTMIPPDRLSAMSARLDATPADVAILVSDADEPLGVMRVRCGALRGIKPKGFVDLKEQVLPQVAAVYDVRVVTMGVGSPQPIRTLTGYLDAMRAFTSRRNGKLPQLGAWREQWRSTFGLVETGATVSDTAVIHDSVVLRGASVGDHAAVVRSIVGAGAVVQAGGVVVDQLLGDAARRRAAVEGGPAAGEGGAVA
jgi:mannose-1-phosphate guanylyltransferase